MPPIAACLNLYLLIRSEHHSCPLRLMRWMNIAMDCAGDYLDGNQAAFKCQAGFKPATIYRSLTRLRLSIVSVRFGAHSLWETESLHIPITIDRSISDLQKHRFLSL